MSDQVSALYEYFASDHDETASPFLKPKSRIWARLLLLKASLVSLCFLLLAYISLFFNENLSHFFVVFVYFLSGVPALIKTLEDLKEIDVNIDVLMTLAALLSALIGSELEGGLLLVLFALSEAMADMVTHKTKSAINSLHKLSPNRAFVWDEKTKTAYPKSVREIKLDTILLIKAGEVIPLDGLIIEGSSDVDLKHLTGESVPLSKSVGDDIPAGALILEGSLKVRVTKTSSDSTLAKIIELITKAQNAKPKLERLLDRFGRGYAMTIIVLSVGFGVFLPLFFSHIAYFGIEGSIYRALAFLIAASPCALIIATPTAYLSAISACAKKGVLLKGGATLDAVAKCQMIAFDKTGTLTTGNLSVEKIKFFSLDTKKSLEDEKKALSLAAGLEHAVVHPIANAVINEAKERGISLCPFSQIRSIPGKGVMGETSIDGISKLVLIGRKAFIEEHLSSEQKENFLKWHEQNYEKGYLQTVLFFNGSIVLFLLRDELRSGIAEIIKGLRDHLVGKIAMLTGDHQENADQVAKILGIDQVFADLHPEDKLRIVDELTTKISLAMVGDGINDAPSLARADVGIAMGVIGSQTAMHAADIVLLRDDLSTISWVFQRAKKTMQLVKQNIFLSLVVILFATTPSLLGFLPLWAAVVLHEGGTVLVGLNSLRLLKK